jgi:hypothetical protein
MGVKMADGGKIVSCATDIASSRFDDMFCSSRAVIEHGAHSESSAAVSELKATVADDGAATNLDGDSE